MTAPLTPKADVSRLPAPGVAALVCPYCGERVMVEYDAILQRGFCAACGRLFAVKAPP
jgi:hypothetical protein